MRANWCCAGRTCTFPGRRNPACCGLARPPGSRRSPRGSRTAGSPSGNSPSPASMRPWPRWTPARCRRRARRGSAARSGISPRGSPRRVRDGAAGLNVTLDGQDKANGLGASFTGQLAPDGTLAGTIASRGPNLAVLLPTPPVPFRADGRLTVRSGLAAVDGLALEIGGSPANGAVALRVAPTQRLDIALAASRLDLDAWLPVLLRAGHHDRRDRRADRLRLLGRGRAAGRRHAGACAGRVRSDRQGPRRARGQRAVARQRHAAAERTHRPRRSGASSLRRRCAARRTGAAGDAALAGRGVAGDAAATPPGGVAGQRGATGGAVRPCGGRRRRGRAAAARRHAG